MGLSTSGDKEALMRDYEALINVARPDRGPAAAVYIPDNRRGA